MKAVIYLELNATLLHLQVASFMGCARKLRLLRSSCPCVAAPSEVPVCVRLLHFYQEVTSQTEQLIRNQSTVNDRVLRFESHVCCVKNTCSRFTEQVH